MTASPSPDRRNGSRFPIELPVELDHGTGRTRDLGSSGVYFETQEPFVPGAPLRLIVLLERAAFLVSEGATASPLRLECEGYVVRVERREGRLGVAAALSSSRLVPLTAAGQPMGDLRGATAPWS